MSRTSTARKVNRRTSVAAIVATAAEIVADEVEIGVATAAAVVVAADGIVAVAAAVVDAVPAAVETAAEIVTGNLQ